MDQIAELEFTDKDFPERWSQVEEVLAPHTL